MKFNLQLAIAKGGKFIITVGSHRPENNEIQSFIICDTVADVAAEMTLLAGKLEAATQRNRG